jgi:hypothetical protein
MCGMSEMTHRHLAYLRILDGIQRLDSLDYHATPEALQAEARVMDAVKEYEAGKPLSIVRDAFRVWADIQTEQSKPRVLF